MKIKLLIIILLFFLGNQQLYSQKNKENFDSNDFFSYLQDKENQYGEINIYQDPKIHYLIDKHIRINNKKRGINGFRIQIFSSSGNDAREKANDVRSDFVYSFPDFNSGLIYLIYRPPFFKIRIGDFRSRSEALKLYKELVGKYPNSYIINDIINYPKLEQEN